MTRAVVKFSYGTEVVARIYIHSDGAPETLGAGLNTFLKLLKANVKDPRLDDAPYLAAKFVVYMAAIHNEYAQWRDNTAHPLEFLSVGIVSEVGDDVQYIYTVDCDKMVKGFPTVTCVDRDDKPVKIPNKEGCQLWMDPDDVLRQGVQRHPVLKGFRD
jgi:hypothetical protein